MILRVKKRGDGRSASPTVRFKGERDPSEGAPGSFLGGPLGAVAPPASFNVQEERGNVPMSATLRARARDGRWGRGGWMVLGRWGRGGWMVLGKGGGGWMVLRGLVWEWMV